MKSSLSTSIFLILTILSCGHFMEGNAFSVVLVPQKQVSSFTLLHLHPDQAADLAACAYQLKNDDNDDVDNLVRTKSRRTIEQKCTGPVAWCRRFLSKALHLKDFSSSSSLQV
jgi:hypothetical protein